MAIREGRWDCSSCGSTAIYGRHVDCPGCGRPRPAGVRFYLTDNAPVVTDPQQLAEARAGADWICAHCEASNRATLHACGGCGAARGTSPSQPVHDYAPGAVPRTGTPAKPSASGLATAPGSRWILPAIAAVFGGLFLLIGWAAFAAQRSDADSRYSSYVPADPVPAVVAGKRWDRRIEARVRTLVPGQGYAPPDSARVLTTVQRRTGESRVVDRYVTSTRQVERSVPVLDGYETVSHEVEETVRTGTRTYVCGQRDLGNGYFEDRECTEPEYETRTRTVQRREPRYRYETRMETVTDHTPVYRTVPVYRTWYTWNQPVWRDTVFTAEGDSTQPAWPRVQPSASLAEVGRSGGYVITFRFGLGQDTRDAVVSPEEWARYQPGQPVAIRERAYSSYQLLPADSLPVCIRWHNGSQVTAPPLSLGCSPRAGSPRTDSLGPDSVRAHSALPDSTN
jgi:hypothetical protein